MRCESFLHYQDSKTISFCENSMVSFKFNSPLPSAQVLLPTTVSASIKTPSALTILQETEIFQSFSPVISQRFGDLTQIQVIHPTLLMI